MKIYVFGNEFVEQDSLAVKIADELEINNVEFVKCCSPEEIDDYSELIIMDTVKGINKVTIIKNSNQLKKTNTATCHDFDLAFHLKLMKKMGKLNKITIIGIPMNGDKEKIKRELQNLLPINF